MTKLALAQHVNSHLILDGNKYEIVEFNTVITQPTDHKGQPQHETEGGLLCITLTRSVDGILYEWAKTSTLQKKGEIVFFSEISGTVMKVEFFNAYCVHMEHNIKSSGGLSVMLTVSPERLIINGIEHDNFWTK
jgi:hypothetical protein